MSLLRYEEAAPWVNAIKLAVLERRMPPWLPEEGIGSWRGARSLDARELDLLVDWASGGAPRGRGTEEDAAAPEGRAGAAPSDGPASEETPSDLVVEAEHESVLGPDVAERTDCVVFRVRLMQDRAVVALELRPGNLAVVRSAILYASETCPDADRPLATWLPGDAAFEMPPGTAERVRRGASLSARILYKKPWSLDGKTVRDRSRLALRFAKGRTAALAHLKLEAGRSVTLARAARLVSAFPDAARGAGLRLEVRRPGQRAEPLLSIDRFDPDWRAKYVLLRPPELPAGTRLEAVSGGFWIDSIEWAGR
jgi:hypothetical protein